MQPWKKVLTGGLILLGIATVPALADDKKEHWEYRERKGYSAPQVSAADARNTVEASRATWRIGTVRPKWESEGVEVDVYIQSDAGRVAKLAVDPETGEILPRGFEVYGKDLKRSQEEIAARVAAVLPRLQVGDRAWLGEHGRYWRIPLFLDGALVSTVKVDARRGTLLVGRADEVDDEDD